MSELSGLTCKHGHPLNEACDECDPLGEGELWTRMVAVMGTAEWKVLVKFLEAVKGSGFGSVTIEIEKGEIRTLRPSISIRLYPANREKTG